MPISHSEKGFSGEGVGGRLRPSQTVQFGPHTPRCECKFSDKTEARRQPHRKLDAPSPKSSSLTGIRSGPERAVAGMASRQAPHGNEISTLTVGIFTATTDGKIVGLKLLQGCFRVAILLVKK